jgi:sphingolipid delta-4 desaturase
MATVPDGFSHTDSPEPHKARTRAILREHPDVREHIGRNPYSFLGIVALVGLQMFLASWIVGRPWWLLLLLAYTAGAVSNHALFVMIHECAHNLLFKSKVLNTLAGILANFPSVLPSSVSFKHYHLAHHSHQGVYELDADVPNEWEAKLVGNSGIRKALWLFLFPIIAVTHTFRVKEVRMVDRWVVLNWIIIIAVDVFLWQVWGPAAFWYLLASMFFSAGFHPLGARWIQRHYLMGTSQETYSYYGTANRLAFNVGYHNEHHDFPSIPWSRLPSLKAAAPEYYENLVAHTSWTRLLFKWVADSDLSLYSRMLRTEDAKVTPDSSPNEPVTTGMGGGDSEAALAAAGVSREE